MYISRKTFIKSASLLTGGILLGIHDSLAKVLQQEDSGFKVLRDNLGIYLGGGGTIFWYISDDAVVVIDTQNPGSAKNFITGLKEKTNRKINFLFNTHHHADHTSGNIYFKPYVEKIVAQENCPKLQKKAYGEGEKANEQVYADTTFSDKWSQNLGKEKITAAYITPAHTGGDIIIHFEKANIAHVGDLVFNRVYPFIDKNGGGSIASWVEVLEKAEKQYPDDTMFIYGHADTNENTTGKKEDLTSMRNYLSALLDYTSKGIKNGKSPEELQKVTKIPGVKVRKERWPGTLAANIDAAYSELKK
jgi:glyoxylase-like metal-dependent hydrolase (beta-lactamase superfamily II)